MIRLKWTKEFFYCCITIVLVWLLLIALALVTDNYYSRFLYPLWSVISLSIIWIAIRAIQNSDKFTGTELSKEVVTINDGYFLKLETLMKEHNRDPNLTLKKLSLVLGIGVNKTSSILKKQNSNFYSYINFHGIEDAKELLTTSKLSYLTIEAIGLEAGFKSKSSFFDNFKKATGLSPHQYRAKIVRPN